MSAFIEVFFYFWLGFLWKCIMLYLDIWEWLWEQMAVGQIGSFWSFTEPYVKQDAIMASKYRSCTWTQHEATGSHLCGVYISSIFSFFFFVNRCITFLCLFNLQDILNLRLVSHFTRLIHVHHAVVLFLHFNLKLGGCQAMWWQHVI